MGYWHAHPRQHPNRWGALVAVSLALFAIAVSTTGITDVLTDMGNDLNMGTSGQTWIMNIYMLMVAAFIVAGGQLGDILGRRFLFMAGTAVFLAGSVLIATADMTATVIVGRAVQGLGAACVVPATLSIIDVSFSREQRALAIGIWGAIAGIGFALGPVIGGLLTHLFSWHWLFWFNVPFGLLALAISLVSISESRDEGRSRTVDFAGMVIMAVAMFSIILGLDRGESWGWDSIQTLSLILGAAVMVVVFIYVESRLQNPMVHFELFKSKAFIAGNVGTFIITWGLITVLFFVANYLQNFLLLDYTALHAGVALLPFGVAMFTVSLVSGTIIRWFGLQWMMGLGMLLMAVGFFLMAVVSDGSGYSAFLPALIIAGAGLGLTFGPLSAVAVASVGAGKVGEASGLVNMSRYIGAALGVAVSTVVYNSAALNRLSEVIGNLGINADAGTKLDQLVAGNDSIAKAEIEKAWTGEKCVCRGGRSGDNQRLHCRDAHRSNRVRNWRFNLRGLAFKKTSHRGAAGRA